jgi:putative salt-induced outer membrane protein YdiY
LNYSLQDIGDQNLGLKTKLTDNLKLGVEMDQLPAPPGETNIYYSRKINGEVDLNENMSLNISQEVLPQDRMPTSSVAGSQDAQAGPETQIYWQYKKRF